MWHTLAWVCLAVLVIAAIWLALTRLVPWPRTRALLTPLAAQHRLSRLDEDSAAWERAFAGEMLWLAHRGVLRIHEVDDAGAAQRLRAAGFRAPRSSGWEIERMRDDPQLPSWTLALVDAYFPRGRPTRWRRIRVDRTGFDDAARRSRAKSLVVAALDAARVERTDRLGWVSRLLASAYSRAFAGVVLGYAALLLPIGALPAPAAAILVLAWLAVAVLTFIRPPLQRRWTKLWERLHTESRHLPSVPVADRGEGATRFLYLDTLAENLGFADIVAPGQLGDVAAAFAEQSAAMTREELLDRLEPDWLVPASEHTTRAQLAGLIDDFAFTVR